MRLDRQALKYRLEYVALRAVIAVFRALPLETASALGGALWEAVAPHTSRHRRAERHLALMMPELSAEDRQRILRGMWRNLGQTAIESLMLDRIAAEPWRLLVDEECQILQARIMAEGGILVAAHLGNWEVAALPLGQAHANHAAVYRRMKNPLAERYVLALRAPLYPAGLFAKGEAAARGLMRQAKAGGSIGIMGDLRENGGIDVPFFGHPAPSTPFPAMLARQYQRPLFAVCTVRTGRVRFRTVLREITVPRTEDRAADILAATAEIQTTFETWIRRWPEQWMWAHRRIDFDAAG